MTAPPPERALFWLAETGLPRYRLVCLHHAGAGTSAFAAWRHELPCDVEMWAPRLPGRESRIHEPFVTDVAGATDDVLATLAPVLADDVPLGFYGHSMGALVAYEVVRALRRRHATDPAFLVVGSAPAPHWHAAASPRLSPGAGRGDLVALLESYAGTVPEVYANDELLDLVLRVLEADFSLMDAYVPEPPTSPLTCPVATFWGEHDRVVAGEAVEAWREYTVGGHHHDVLDGGHFLVGSHGARIMAGIDEVASAALATTRAVEP